MKTFLFGTLLLLAPALRAQHVIDLHACEPGRWHDARDCHGCGVYKGATVLCFDKSASVRYVEIRVPQGFIKLEKVNVSLSIKPMHGKGPRFKVTSIDRNSLGKMVTQFGINAQSSDGSAPTEQYYVKYKISGQ